jgi:predicted nucleic acid-binding protein
MVSGVLIDSNYYISHLRGGRNPFRQLADVEEKWEFFTTGMVMLEVLRGVRDARQLVKFEASFSLMNFIPAKHNIWTRAHRLAWELDRAGIIIPVQDHLIAACAVELDLAVLTADAHFQHYPGLKVLRCLLD